MANLALITTQMNFTCPNFSDGPRAVQTAGGDSAQLQGEGQHQHTQLRH